MSAAEEFLDAVRFAILSHDSRLPACNLKILGMPDVEFCIGIGIGFRELFLDPTLIAVRH